MAVAQGTCFTIVFWTNVEEQVGVIVRKKCREKLMCPKDDQIQMFKNTNGRLNHLEKNDNV